MAPTALASEPQYRAISSISTLACGTPMPISNESALVEPCFCLRRRAYFDGQRGLRPAASHETELESSETIHVRRIQPTLVVVDRTEHEATDLIVPAQDPIRYGEHLAASVATYGPQQHRGPVKEERRVAGEREGCCIQRSKDKRNEHGDVDGCGQGAGRFKTGLGSAGANPLPSKQERWKCDNANPNRQGIEAGLDFAVHHLDATSGQ